MVGLEKRYRAAEDLTVKGREKKMSGKEKAKEESFWSGVCPSLRSHVLLWSQVLRILKK